MEKAPDLVKACLESLRRNIRNKELVIICEANYSEYVHLPDDIVDKYRKGVIPPALFADMLRLELLIRHGGTWIDSTVLCTGDNFPSKVLSCDLFLFQYIRPDGRVAGYSNWFITSCTNNRLLLVLRDMLYAYWRDFDCVLDYYIFHFFFSMLAERFPREIAAMPRGNNYLTLQLGRRLDDRYDDRWMETLISRCAFHKMNYRVEEDTKRHQGNFYNEILCRYGRPL